MAAMKRRATAEDDGHLRTATLGEVAGLAVDILCRCNRCAHNTVLPSGGLADRLGAGVPVPEVGARLRCSRCGGKDVATWPAWPSLDRAARHG